MRILTIFSVCALGCFLDLRVLAADESKELRERAIAMRREAAELLANGHEEESNRLTKESMTLLEKARKIAAVREQKPEQHHPDVAAMHERLRDLNAALEKGRAASAPDAEIKEFEEQIQQTKKKLAAIVVKAQSHHPANHDRPEIGKKLEHAHRRLQHLRVAAENLKAAEMHDLAVEVMKKAEDLERDFRAAHAESNREATGARSDVEQEMRLLREENERLQNTIRELSKKTKE